MICNYLRSEFGAKLNTAVVANGNSQIHHIDLSNNMIDDKGEGFVFNIIIV